ncbi:MAG: L-threonylcarbamoyladenylate synthase [Candidatus Andersenbacteria bacterium]
MSPTHLERAVSLLQSGEVLAVATDTVFGLMCDPCNQAAVDKIFTLKGRDFTKPLQVLAVDRKQAQDLIEIPEHAVELTHEWPGALTLVAKAKVQLAKRVGKENTLGVRVPTGATITALLQAFGPVAATSANPSGQSPATTKAQVAAYFGDTIPLILGEDREVASGSASKVVDVTHQPHVVLRQPSNPNARTTRS